MPDQKADLKTRVGRKIRELRENKGLSQTDLGNEAKASFVTISSIERGQAATNLDLLERITKALGTTPVALISEQSMSSLRREILDMISRVNEDQLAPIHSFLSGLLKAQETLLKLKKKRETDTG